jgi:hypothetical protein
MSTFTELQSAINRFSQDPNGFAPIGVDDIIGYDTYAATVMALSIISDGCPNPSAVSQTFDCPRPGLAPFSADATALFNAISNADDVKANAPTLLALILNSADALGYGYVAPPAPTPIVLAKKPPVPRGTLPFALRRKIGGGFLGLGLPDWVPYAGGAVLVVGTLVAIASRMKKRKMQVAGWR